MPAGYRKICCLGSGSYSEVSLAEHQRLAVKRVIKEAGKAPFSREMLRREAELLLQIHHPQIPTIYDYMEDGDRAVLVEEYMEGVSLQTYLSDHHHAEESAVCDIGIALCELLSDLLLLEDPIFYPDLKPEHVILTGNAIKLIDFGTALRASELKEKGIPLGITEEYAAPELLRGEVMSEAASVYAIGRILAFLLFGDLAYEENNFEGKPSDDCIYKEGDVGSGLESVIRTACAEELSQRCPSIHQLFLDLKSTKENLIPIAKGRTGRSQIAVIGSEPHIGTTYTAIHTTIYLNQTGRKACYYVPFGQHPLASLRGTAADKGKGTQGKGIFTKGFFSADYLYRPGEYEARQELQILDLGCFSPELLKVAKGMDCILLVGGTKPWEQEYTLRLAEAFRGWNNAKMLLSFSNTAEAKTMGRKLGMSVFRIPFGSDLWSLTREEQRFYQAMWNKVKER